MDEVDRARADQEEEDRLRQLEEADGQQAAVVMPRGALVACARLVLAAVPVSSIWIPLIRFDAAPHLQYAL